MYILYRQVRMLPNVVHVVSVRLCCTRQCISAHFVAVLFQVIIFMDSSRHYPTFLWQHNEDHHGILQRSWAKQSVRHFLREEIMHVYCEMFCLCHRSMVLQLRITQTEIEEYLIEDTSDRWACAKNFKFLFRYKLYIIMPVKWWVTVLILSFFRRYRNKYEDKAKKIQNTIIVIA